MIAYRLVMLTDPKDINSADVIEVQYGTKTAAVCGEMVRDFVKCVRNAYATSQYVDALEELLKTAPPDIRFVLRYLYSELEDKI